MLGLLFSTGGVAIVGQAGSNADQTPAPQAAPSECEAPGGFRPIPNTKPHVLKDAPDNKSIVLNTSGYNYALEGEWRPSPVGEPLDVPEGVLPNDAGSAPPAAPARK